MSTTASDFPASPLDPVFAGHARVPPAFAEQLLRVERRPSGVRLEGVMHRIWHRPAFLGPLFRLLGKFGILVPYNAEDVPTTLVIRSGRHPADGPYQVWDRTFRFARPFRSRTTTIYDPALGKVVDLVGPGNVLYMAWEARFHPPDRFTLDTDSCALRIGRRKLWMPRRLWKFLLGTVAFAQVADPEEADLVRIDLLITHPLFGRVFGYEGSFRVIRAEEGAEAEPGGPGAEVPRDRSGPLD